MPSFYDTPAESNYINTYIPLPFEEIAQAGLARQSRYDQALAAMGENQSYLESLVAGPFPEQQAYLASAVQKMEELTNRYAKEDLSQGFIRRQLREDLRRSIDPSTLTNITHSYENYLKRQEYKKELSIRGMYFEPYEETLDPALTGQLGASELYDYLPTAFEDPDEMIINRFKSLPVTENTYSRNGEIMLHQTNKEAISQVMTETVRSLKDTPQGRWIIKQAKQNGTYTGDDYSTVQAYVESLKPQYTIDNYRHQAFIPGYGSASDGLSDPKALPLIDMLGEAEQRPKEDYKGKQFFNDREELKQRQAKVTSDLNIARESGDESIIAQKEKEIEGINNLIAEKESVLRAVAEEKGIDIDGRMSELKQNIQKRYQHLTYQYPNDLISKVIEYSDANALNTTYNRIEELSSNKNFMGFINSIIEDTGIETIKTTVNIPSPFVTRAPKPDVVFTDEYNKIKNNLINIAHEYKLGQDKLDKELKTALKETEIIPSSTQDRTYTATMIKTSGGVGLAYDAYSIYGNNPDYNAPSGTFAVLKNIQLNPDERYVSVMSGSKDNKLKSFKNAVSFEITEIGAEPDDKGWYVITKIKGEDDKILSDTKYKVYLTTPSQREAVGRDFLMSGNLLDAYMWKRPETAEQIAAFTKGEKETINVYDPTAKDLESAYVGIEVHRLPNGKYKTVNPYTGEKSIFEFNKTELTRELYKYGFKSLENYFNERYPTPEEANKALFDYLRSLYTTAFVNE